MDGVVVDSEPLHEKAAVRVFERHGLHVPPEVFPQFKGKTALDAFSYAVNTFGNATLDAVALLAQKQQLYQQSLGELLPVRGALPFIYKARHLYRLGLTTSGIRQNQQLVFARFELDQFFYAVVTADDITYAKPHPEPYLLTAEKMGLRPEGCLVIEDAPHGVRSAKSAGCRVIGLTTSFSAAELVEAGADETAGGFEELVYLVDRTS